MALRLPLKLALHKDLQDLILKTSKGEIRVMKVKKKLHMERCYEGSNILFLESRAYSMSLQIWIRFFTIYSASNI